MSLIATRALSLTLGLPLFAGLNLNLNAGDRLGLVACNGRGKSSLLALLAGEIEPSGGEITRARGLTFAHVSQDVPPAMLARSLAEAVEAVVPGEEWRAGIALDALEVPWELRDQPLAALSGGWQRTALLAQAAVLEPDLYLLDEPTNHLDLARIGVLQGWLAGLPKACGVILTSHDRAFLDAVCTRTLFLRPEASRDFALPYSKARAALEIADASDARQHENDLAKADQLRRQAAKLKNIGINSGSDLLVVKTKQLTERAEKIESAARAAHRDRSAGAIKLDSAEARARALLALDCEVRVPGDTGPLLFRTGPKWIGPGDRVVLLGANGAGKTQLVNAVLAACQGTPLQGVKPAGSMVLGHAGQMLEELDPKASPFALVTQYLADQSARSQLASAGIGPDWQGKKLGLLSGGQRARLMLLLLRLRRPNFYLLDEPTNHLDIEGQEALEAELQTQGAAALLVSHDRAFIRAVGTRFWWIKGQKLEEIDSPEPFFASQAMG
ncbi:ABC-F family ATP-binding cassette domain-containing protein [Xinfangfangia sp. CPCC 101601]|uniref:ABC-F family ATP-binding cassette domain-containing protein n=1 Tax=Pseudogemmobacter lacusdianii TaxID=3069608 RepID=A0ABU0VVA3_9RHOB|nr:ABC-F family ATP-binding cassette domain-containing protein [Xinfangfangia sp. CPCC 101601]MDQ2064905.1 ABC-F family ATP-binding cassette domain-containing protein [Xinfangfangia sp. CPCC 101601]